MYVIESGQCHYQIGTHNGIAHHGDILICPPKIAFARKMLSPLSFHFFRFGLETDMFSSSHLIGITRKVSQRVFDDCNIIHYYEFDYSSKTNLIKNHLLDDIFFTFLYRRTVQEQEKMLTRSNPDISGLMHFIDENYDQPLRLLDLANLCNLSPEYLSRKFHHVTGQSLSAYIEKVRLNHVQELLVNTNLTLDEIAKQVGYSSGIYLSRRFHTVTNQWPNLFRKGL